MNERRWKRRVDTGADATAPLPPPAESATAGIPWRPTRPTATSSSTATPCGASPRCSCEIPGTGPKSGRSIRRCKNPHLIYPGDTLRLVYVDGRPRIVLQPGSGARQWCARDSAGAQPAARGGDHHDSLRDRCRLHVQALGAREESDQACALRARHPRFARHDVRRRHGVRARLQPSGRARHALQRGTRRRATARSG